MPEHDRTQYWQYGSAAWWDKRGIAYPLFEGDPTVAGWWRYGSGHSTRFDSPDTFMTAWADRSSHENNLAQATASFQPLIGDTSIRIDTVDKNLFMASQPEFGLLNGLAIFVVMDTTEVIGGNRLIMAKWNSQAFGEWALFYRFYTGAYNSAFFMSNAAATGRYEVENVAINDGNLHLVQAIYDGSEIKLRIDDGSETTTAAPDFRAYEPTTSIAIAKYSTQGNPSSRQNIREIIVLEETPTAELLLSIRDYISIRHGVAV